MYFDAMQSALAKIRSFGQLNARCANQFSFLCACEDFMDVIMELTTDLRLTLSAEILNPLISKLVDTIKFHVKNNATVNPKEAIMYKKTMGIFSHRLIQKSLDVINILFDHSKRTEPSFDIWAVHLASNGFTPLDSIYFLKFYCLGAPLRISMESAAVQVWDKNYLITHDL